MFSKLKKAINALMESLTIISVAISNKETPWYAKVAAYITLGYALSPIDLIPDFIPVLGYIDDIIILPLLILLTIKLIPNRILSESKEEAKDLWKNGKPTKWFYAIPIVLIWIITIIWVINNFI